MNALLDSCLPILVGGFHRRLECPESWLAETPAFGRIETGGLDIAFVSPGAICGENLACIFANCRYDWLTQVVVVGLSGLSRWRRGIGERVAEVVIDHAERMDVAVGLVPEILKRCDRWGLHSILAMAHYTSTGRFAFCRTAGTPTIVFRRHASEISFTLGLGQEASGHVRAEHRAEPGDQIVMLGSARPDWMDEGVVGRIRGALGELRATGPVETVEGLLSSPCLARLRSRLTVVAAEVLR